MKLLYQTHSPYARKVLVAAHEMGLQQRLCVIHHETSPTRRNEEVLALNPLGKVPVLICDDGVVLFDSNVICEYLDTLHGGTKLFPPSGKPRWIALRQQALGDGILDAAILGRYEVQRPKEFQWQDWIDAQLRKVRGALGALEIEVQGGELGGALTIGQITVACALGYLNFRYASEDWPSKHRHLASWYEELSKRKSIQLTAPRDPT